MIVIKRTVVAITPILNTINTLKFNQAMDCSRTYIQINSKKKILQDPKKKPSKNPPFLII